ncbi:response regulator [Lichenicola sp.]|uniref:response regulator n=1 Tax=Lichenicola sp. TaxID=2804529 RepID=UPI003AFF91C0
MPDLLVVDDDEDVLALPCRSCRSHAYRLTAASRGAGLFQALSAGAIDLVIPDVMMPGKGGLRRCRWMRQDWNTPIIMLTAAMTYTHRVVGPRCRGRRA